MHLCKFTLIIILQRSVNDDFFCCCCWLITTPCSTSIQGTPLFKRHLPWSQGCLLNGARYSTITILRRQKVHCRKTKKYIYSYCKTQQRLQKITYLQIDRSINLWILRDAYQILFCVFVDFCASGMPDAEVRKSTKICSFFCQKSPQLMDLFLFTLWSSRNIHTPTLRGQFYFRPPIPVRGC